MKKIILVAGGTGNLGGRVIQSLLDKGAEVCIVVRQESDRDTLNKLKKLGVKVFLVKNWNVEEISHACQGAFCVVSA
ncbi:MAG: NmrA family NAD(P)-binding protein, partial [Cyclobacteriaceae bacterium]